LCSALGTGCGTSAPASDAARADGGSGSDAATTSTTDAGSGKPTDAGGKAGDSGGAPGDASTSPVDAGGGPGAACTGAKHSSANPASNLPAVPAVTIPSGFKIETVASVSGARELAALPNGDLLVGTSGQKIVLVPNADGSTAPGSPVTFTTIGDAPVQGVAFDAPSCTIFVASNGGVYSIAYSDGQTSAQAGTPIARLRQGAISPNRPAGDTDNHSTSSVAVSGRKVYASAGSSCNACAEVDPTRAAIQVMDADGSNVTPRATRIRNAIALATNPATGTVWAGGAGQDNLPTGHPYEFFDAVTSHSGVADYGWPDCEEDRVAYTTGADSSRTVEPLIELPAYSTIIGATFYPPASSGAYAFPAPYKGGLFLSAHGSWHTTASGYYSAPIVVFVAMNGDTPQVPVSWGMTIGWSDPSKQWSDFVSGFQGNDGTTRIGRPTGVIVGPEGSLFVGDDDNGLVYRIRPN
jgi:glucose/arabinose dehydrogenase